MKRLLHVLFASLVAIGLQACASQSQIKIKSFPYANAPRKAQGDAGTAEFVKVRSVNLGEWTKVQQFAIGNGYDLAAPELMTLPNKKVVYEVSWWDAIKWCNAKSTMHGLTPAYFSEGKIYKTGMNTPEINPRSNGYKWVAEPTLKVAQINLR